MLHRESLKTVCQHNRLQPQCKECSGASMCIHKRRKTICKECGGGGLCQHGKDSVENVVEVYFVNMEQDTTFAKNVEVCLFVNTTVKGMYV